MFLDSSLPFADCKLEYTAMLLSNVKPKCFNGPTALNVKQTMNFFLILVIDTI